MYLHLSYRTEGGGWNGRISQGAPPAHGEGRVEAISEDLAIIRLLSRSEALPIVWAKSEAGRSP